MAKVITFSRTFPKGHPRAGEPTYFVEAFYKSLNKTKYIPNELESLNHDKFINGFAKHHTIRAGNRFKKGDYFSPRVWGTDINPKSGKSGAYHSKQIILAPDTEILEVYNITIWRESLLNWRIYINTVGINAPKISKLANNDGLTHRDLLDWFNVPIEKVFTGQIICWNENVKY